MIPHETILFFAILAAGLYMAWSIGANDVANAMGTSVGSGALTLKRAVVIAAILEFSGAFFFGAHVSETVQTGIINPQYFASTPLLFVYGMLSALLGVGIWLQFATWYGWPVSTTHSIVGALVGFGAAVGGMEAIYWGNVGFIISSWILSPIFGALIGFSTFMLLRRHIFNQQHPLAAAKRTMPFIVFAVFMTLSLLLIFNGLQHANLEVNLIEAFLFCTAVGLISAAISYFLVRNVKVPFSEPQPGENYHPEMVSSLEQAKMHLLAAQSNGERSSQMDTILSDIDSMQANLAHPEDYESSGKELKLIEKMFGYLQIVSACLMAFAHGANDVANAIGPLAAAIQVLKTGNVFAATNVPIWALALGGLGIVIGLATWGWRVIETIGKKLTELTPTRGFSAEFAAALTILVASRLGMPISTTHTLVGAVVGVGLARGLEALNLGVMKDIFLSWLVTVPAGAIITLVIFWVLTAI